MAPHDQARPQSFPLGRFSRRGGRWPRRRRAAVRARSRSVAPDRGDPRGGAFESAYRATVCARGLAQSRPRTRRGPRPRAVRAGVVGARARSRRRRAFARQARSRPRRDHGRLAGLGFGGNFPRRARPGPPLHGNLRRLRRPGLQLQFWHRADFSASRPGQRAGLHRAAHLVVVGRAPLKADGDVRRRQSEEHAGDQRRHGGACHRPVACGARQRRRRSRQCQPDPRGRPGRGGAGMDRDQARHRYRDAVGADAHLDREPAAR